MDSRRRLDGSNDAGNQSRGSGPLLERNMTLSKVCEVVALLCIVPVAASPQPPAPAVMGKTCRGIFQLQGVTSEMRMGAFEIRFGGSIGKPTAHVWRAFGPSVWQKVSQEVNSGKLSTDLAGFDDLGEARNLLIQDNQVTFNTQHGGSVSLVYDSTAPSVYDGNGIISTAALGEPLGRLEWRGATTHVLCQ